MGTQSIYLKPKTEKMLYDYAAKEHMTTSQVIIKIIEAAVSPEKPADNFDAPVKYKYYASDGVGFETKRQLNKYNEDRRGKRLIIEDAMEAAEEGAETDQPEAV